MKTRWEFIFETTGFKFSKQHRFCGEMRVTKAESTEVREGEVLLEIIPDAEVKFPPADQSGTLQIQLEGTPKDTEDLAYWVATKTADEISFHHHGQMKLHWGFISAKRTPETPEEEAEVGDGLYDVKLLLQKVQEVPEFDPDTICSRAITPESQHLLSQFNTAQRAGHVIDKFLGMFKVLEYLYHHSRKHPKLLNALTASEELFRVSKSVVQVQTESGQQEITREQFPELLRQLTKIRHHCAHLKAGTSQGYLSNDPRLETEVKPYLELLEALTYNCILTMSH